MSSRIKDFPDGKMVKCLACGNIDDSGVSIYPDENTDIDRMKISLGTRAASILCTNPNCRKYSIYAPTSSSVERLIEKYKSK